MAGIGALVVDVQLKLAQFTSEIASVNKQVSSVSGVATKMGNALKTALAGITVGLVVAQFKQLTDTLDQIGDVADAFGYTTQEVARFRNIGQLAGITLADLTTLLQKFGTKVADARRGDGSAVALFDALQISVADLQKLSPGELLERTAKAFAGFEGSAEKVKLIREALGKSGFAMNEFASRLRDGSAELDKFGTKLGEEATKNADEFNRQLALISVNSERAKIGLLSEMLPAINRIITAFTDAKQSGGSFFDAVAAAIQRIEIGDELKKTTEKLAEYQAQLATNDRQLNAAQGRSARTQQLMREREQILQAIKDQENYIKVLKNPTLLTEPTGGTTKPAPKLRDFAEEARAINDQIKRIEKQAKDEVGSLSDSFEDSKRALDNFEISIEAHYKKREDAQRAFLAKTLALLDEEEKLARRLPANTPALAQQKRDTLEDIDSRRADVQRKASRDAIADTDAQSQALENYAKATLETRAAIDELTGKIVSAARIRFQLQNKELEQRARAQGDTGQLDALADLEQLTIRQAQINQLTRDAGIIQQQLSNDEARIRTEREVGTLSELNALRELTVAREAAARQLGEIADKYTKLAEQQRNPETVQQAKNFKQGVDDLAKSADQVAAKFREIGEGGLSTFFSDIIEGTKSVKDAFNDMVRSIMSSLSRLVAQDIAGQIFNSLKKGAGGGGGGGAGIVDTLISFGKQIFARAEGGPVSAGMPYLVGERGPELFVPRSSGSIVPNGAGGTMFAPTFVLQGAVDLATREQIAQASYVGMMRAQRRTG